MPPVRMPTAPLTRAPCDSFPALSVRSEHGDRLVNRSRIHPPQTYAYCHQSYFSGYNSRQLPIVTVVTVMVAGVKNKPRGRSPFGTKFCSHCKQTFHNLCNATKKCPLRCCKGNTLQSASHDSDVRPSSATTPLSSLLKREPLPIDGAAAADADPTENTQRASPFSSLIRSLLVRSRGRSDRCALNLRGMCGASCCGSHDSARSQARSESANAARRGAVGHGQRAARGMSTR